MSYFNPTNKCYLYCVQFVLAIRHEDPSEMVKMIAEAKTKAIIDRGVGPAVLICSDQVIVCNKEVREKPQNVEEAREFLRSYRKYPAEAVVGLSITNTVTSMIL